jgi:hypothetical protein
VLRNLIRKDLILSRNAFLWTGLPFLVYFAVMASEPRVPIREYLVLSALLCALMPVSVFGREDKFKAAPLTCSLPVTRRAMVQARYALAGGCGVIGTAGALALAVLWPWGHFAPSDVLNLGTILFAVTAVVVIASLLMPWVFRFGLFGMIWFLVGLQVLGAVALVASTVMGLGALRPVFRSLGQLVADLHTRLGDPAIAVVVLLGLGALAAVSMRVSVFLSERRDL